MKSTPFDHATDLAPTPFEERHCLLALRLKSAGLRWKPHAGCFVWTGKVSSRFPPPFPSRFTSFSTWDGFWKFNNLENITEKLIWIPTWHQVRLIANLMGIESLKIQGLWSYGSIQTPADEVYLLYELLLVKLESSQLRHLTGGPP
jgi:hypothetical protein